MAYARVTGKNAVLVIFNNDTKPATVAFDVSMIKPIGANSVLESRLGNTGDVEVKNGKILITMPARTAGIFSLKR